MITAAKKLEGCELCARDGTIGHIRDFYFDDEHWHVRYVVVETGSWLDSRRVLLSSAHLAPFVGREGCFSVDLTLDQIRKSPDIDTTRPVSRQHEEELHRYFAWPVYWGGPYIGGGVTAPIGGPAAPTAEAVHASRQPQEGRPGETLRGREPGGPESHLRSIGEVRDYHIDATDGALGHVEDLVLDNVSWAVRYLLVNTRNWLPGKKVLVSPRHIRQVSWLSSSVTIDLPRETIKNGPEFDESRPLDADYVDRLDAHYRGFGGSRGNP
jgi:uncharacterized protein YrrD